MRISEFRITNFKSIRDLTIPLREYVTNNNKNRVTFLVGLNETGKSTILQALSYLAVNDTYKQIKYERDCNKEAFNDDEPITISAKIIIEKNYFLNKATLYNIPNSLASKLILVDPEISIIVDENNTTKQFWFEFEDFDFHKYAIDRITKTVSGKTIVSQVIIDIALQNKVNEKITEENATTFLTESQTLLTKELFDDYLSNKLNNWYRFHIQTIQLWKPTSEYLINETIRLSEFKDDPDISIPLKNIFHISGFKSDTDITTALDKAIGNQGRIEELREILSGTITKHLNKVWKEHKIKLKISINGDDCQVHVEDKDKSFRYYQMEQRSDGFKQFVSLILSLSTLNEIDKLSNNIILIDEPEVHLHPSGVRDMRDEIIKIGKNNHVFVSTHSHYMVDTNCPERHWIVTKEKGETKIRQINEETPFEDDSVLSAAFGLNVFKELLPQNIIIVEGGDDKQIISHTIKQLKPKFLYSIKSAGGASKIPGITTLLNDEKVSAFIILDDDNEGKNNKKNIIEKNKESFTNKNVYTIKDLVSQIPNNSTIEDLLPQDFVKSFFEKEMNQIFEIKNDLAIINQLKNQSPHLKENKTKLESLKTKLSKSFCEEYSSKTKIEDQCKKMTDLVNSLVSKIEEYFSNK